MENILALTNPLQLQDTRGAWLAEKRRELEEARAVVARFIELDETTPRQARRAKDKIKFLEKFLLALEAGYLPIPRFDCRSLNWDEQPMPAHILFSIKEAQNQGIFHEIAIVQGREQGHQNGPYRASRRRDPLVVGIIRYGPLTQPTGYEEHFLIAWWRPENFKPSELL